MTLRFAAARSAATSPVARAFSRRAATPANDNGDPGGSDRMLHVALRQFAEHGFGAARAARKQAEDAFFAGNREGYDWWLGVCRTLDQRMAQQLASKNNDFCTLAEPG